MIITAAANDDSSRAAAAMGALYDTTTFGRRETGCSLMMLSHGARLAACVGAIIAMHGDVNVPWYSSISLLAIVSLLE